MGFTPEQRQKGIETRQRKAEEKRAAKAQASGIGESRRFIAPAGTFSEPSILDCHVAGILVRNLPLEAQGRILYQQTDEGIAERNAGRSEAHVKVGAEPIDKMLSQRRDDVLERGMSMAEAADPLRQLKERYLKPGERAKFLSKMRVDSEGGYTRGAEIVRNERGDPVTYKTLIMAKVPEEVAQERQRKLAAIDHQRISAIETQFDENRRRLERGDNIRPSEPVSEL